MRLQLFLISMLAVSTPAVADQESTFVQNRAHTSVVSDVVLDLYNVTMPGEEVLALPEPISGGFEYWPYVYDAAADTHPHPYPDAIQWGFGAGGDAARRCMKLSYHIWKHVQDHKPAHLASLLAMEGAPQGYYHWNNDYTQARTEELGYRSFWHYSKPNGLLKWISHTKIDGSCQHPTVEAIDRWAACEIKRLENDATQCVGHR